MTQTAKIRRRDDLILLGDRRLGQKGLLGYILAGFASRIESWPQRKAIWGDRAPLNFRSLFLWEFWKKREKVDMPWSFCSSFGELIIKVGELFSTDLTLSSPVWESHPPNHHGGCQYRKQVQQEAENSRLS